MHNLASKTFFGFVRLIFFLGLLTFLPAGTFHYWQAWLYIFIYIFCGVLISVYLLKKDPKLLERRIRGGPRAEKEKSQKIIMVFFFLIFILIFMLSALDHRYNWSHVPLIIVLGGDILVLLGYYVSFIVFRENTYTAASITVEADQKVISTGPYARVRHPLYSGALIIFIGTPLALGSWWGLIIFIPFTLILIWRLLDEEKYLSQNLQGYKEYCQIVHYRLIPFVW